MRLLLILLAATLAAPAQQAYFVLDSLNARPQLSSWPQVDQAVPFGSLLKPFTALAYGERHGYRYPRFECRGGETCWLPGGHGELDLSSAVAHSCNAYFQHLALAVTALDVGRVAARYSIAGPPLDSPPEALWGLGAAWRILPQRLARAYRELVERRAEPGVQPILAGMAQAARNGTAAALAGLPEAALAKTGTAPCVHGPGGQADGYVIALYPAENPRYTILLQAHNHTGRQAAAAAADILSVLLRP
jgi:hypothetical protein